MDMKCLKCREPWDWWYIRDEVLQNEELYQKMKTKGGYISEALFGPRMEIPKADGQKVANWQFTPGPIIAQCPNCIGKEIKLSEKDEFSSELQSALADILGDDVDGLLAMMEVLGF